jgi:hypothetical protein
MREKVRVIVNGISFYTTKAQIKRGVGSHSSLNLFIELALEECLRENLTGLGRTYQMYDAKMQATPYDVQIDL